MENSNFITKDEKLVTLTLDARNIQGATGVVYFKMKPLVADFKQNLAGYIKCSLPEVPDEDDFYNRMLQSGSINVGFTIEGDPTSYFYQEAVVSGSASELKIEFKR